MADKNILAERRDLMKRAEDAWTEVQRREGSSSPLVRMVSWTPLGLDYTAEFSKRYSELTVGEALKRYVSDIEEKVKQYKSH